ncbi:Cytochrome c-552 precursor [Planctomycetes bacterium Poly30]|uniref:Cytochrome c-552 n=1 Tax=Saltatorellus ferox TaxID=2528018 RepID=A0A518EZ48_9BACT|nr:Cytochrome c-552 precursor [Planctomycetes bacterium Poly30]
MRITVSVAPGSVLFFAFLTSIAAPAAAQNGDRKGEVQGDLPADLVIPPAPVLSPEEERATISVPPGFVVDLVAAEPLVVDPVQIVFDELGRLWVVEMTGYMPDIDGNGEHAPIGNIAILTDDDGDGTMDSRTNFATELVLPRGVVPLHGGALCVLPPDLVFLRDDDGDGEFDTREVVATGLTQGLANPEHAINTPILGLDNWIHFSNWDRRVRRTFDDEGNPRWEIQRTRGGGQWGLSMDDVGRIMRNTNPNPLYCDIVPSHYAVRNSHQSRFHGAFAGVDAKNATFPSRINPGVNRGYQPATLRDDFTLAAFTAACSPTVLRGQGLGEAADGDIFVCEPTGNLVKRYDLAQAEGSAKLVATSVHKQVDFLTSTHERFRPVAGTTGPDGTLYLADMYRGLIQHRIFLTSFLRKQIIERDLAGPMGLGRIWRVRRSDAAVGAPEVDLLGAPLVDLAGFLTSDNSWLRDNAQRLLVESVDGEASVLEALREIAGGQDAIGAVHALWTLDGVGYMTPEVLAGALRSTDSRVRCVAAEIAGSWLGLEGNDLLTQVAGMVTSDRDPRARLYSILAIGESDAEVAQDALADRMTTDASSSLERSAVISGLEYREAAFLAALAEREDWLEERPGRKALLKELAECVGREGVYENVGMAVDLALTHPAKWWSDALLEGLYATRQKGPKGERLPLPLRAMPVALSTASPVPDASSPIFAAVDEGCTWPGKPGAVEIEIPRDLTEPEKALFDRGAEVFTEACATCHQSHGGGEEGKAPTLRGTRFVVGPEPRLIRILMHGLEGPVEIDGQTWNQEMPRYEGEDEDLAAVLTFIRRSWGNGADPITPAMVEVQRKETAGRTQPMSAND